MLSRLSLVLGLCLGMTSTVFAQKILVDDHGTLSSRWALDDSTRQENFLILPYKPVYFLPFSWSDRPNRQPDSGNPATSLPVEVPLQATEFKFQFSFKFKVWQGIFGHNGDLWLAYTQTSRWQMYNAELSRLFRETNYEPEAILNFHTDVRLLGFRMCLLGGGINHQSNGRSYFLTRSWNRIIGQVGFERPSWSVVLRPWMRLPEETAMDENPRIDRFMGRGDLLVVYAKAGHQVSFLGRHSLDFSPGRGSVQLDWAIPVSGRFKAHVQLFSGHGESMIDFNHRQTTIGLGFSLLEWL